MRPKVQSDAANPHNTTIAVLTERFSMTKINWRWALSGAGPLALILLFACAGSASAALSLPTHKWTWFDLSVKPGEVFREQWAWNDLAQASSRPPGCSKQDKSSGKTPFFTPPSNGFETADAVCPKAAATAQSSFTSANNGRNSHDVFAHATVVPPGPARAFASAQSVLGFQVGTSDRRGRISWVPGWHVSTLEAHSVAAVGSDPIDVSFLNLDTGELQTSRLWESKVILNGEGNSVWESGRVQLSGLSGEFLVELESPYITSGTGSMRLLFDDGLVTLSEDSGIFDGLLPVIGELASLDFAFGDVLGSIDIAFDFGSINNSGFVFTGEISAEATALAEVPEPSTAWLVLWTLLGLALSQARWGGAASPKQSP